MSVLAFFSLLPVAVAGRTRSLHVNVAACSRSLLLIVSECYGSLALVLPVAVTGCSLSFLRAPVRCSSPVAPVFAAGFDTHAALVAAAVSLFLSLSSRSCRRCLCHSRAAPVAAIIAAAVSTVFVAPIAFPLVCCSSIMTMTRESIHDRRDESVCTRSCRGCCGADNAALSVARERNGEFSEPYATKVLN